MTVRAEHKVRHFRVHFDRASSVAQPEQTDTTGAGAGASASSTATATAGNTNPIAVNGTSPAAAVQAGHGRFLIGQLSFERFEQLLEHYTRHPIYRAADGEVLYLIRPLQVLPK